MSQVDRLLLARGVTAGQLIAQLAELDPDDRLVCGDDGVILRWLRVESLADDTAGGMPLTAADRLDRARTAPDRTTAARLLTDGEDIPARGDLAALLRSAGWPCSTDTARDLRADLVAARQQPVGPALTAGTGG